MVLALRLTIRSLVVGALLIGCSATGVDRPGLPTAADGALQIVVFNVGQADAALIHYRGRSMLVDAGSAQIDSQATVRRVPSRLDAIIGDRSLDYFMISHYHRDHIGAPSSRNNRNPSGIFALVERRGVTIDTVLDRGQWVIGDAPRLQTSFGDAVERWRSIGAVNTRRIVRPGDRIEMGAGLEVEIVSVSGNGYLEKLLAAAPGVIEATPPSENDYSIGFVVRLGDFEYFSAGDLSGQSVLRRFGRKSQLYTDVESPVAELIGPIEVYRVNHHGSRHSSNSCFASVLHPQVSIFSTGKNTYGHPDIDVYERLKEYGDVLITGGADKRVIDRVNDDIVGSDVEIIVAPDGSRYWVNGKEYASYPDSLEEARADYRDRCDESPLVLEDRAPRDDQAGN